MAQTLFRILLSILAGTVLLSLAKPVLVPLAYAVLIAFILFPTVKRLERWGLNDILASFLSIATVLLIMTAAMFLVLTQVVALSQDLPGFEAKFLRLFADTTLYINQNMGIVPNLKRDELLNQTQDWFKSSLGSMAGTTFSGFARLLTAFILTTVYTFLILIYRRGLTAAFIRFFPEETQPDAHRALKAVQEVGQRYLFGLMTVIGIVGSLNSAGLWLLGVEHALLFGYMASVLTIVPFIGTLVGASIPMIFVYVATDSGWTVLGIAALFWFVQLLESNLITPKIVGGNLRINALTSITSIVVGAAIWGIAGMVLFLPYAAMVFVVCTRVERLKPLAALIGEQRVVSGAVS